MQHVNLLSDDLRPRRDPFTMREMLLVWVAFIVLLLLWSAWQGFGWWQLKTDRGRIAAEVAQIEAANATLVQNSKKEPDPELVSNVAELQAARREQALIRELLSGVATSDGFSSRLQDLAQFKVDGLWLQSFSFAAGGEQISLSGYSEKAATVPVFLSALSAGPGFSGYAFDSFEIRDSEDDLIEFEISGPLEGAP
ncbi:MAG: PilN domain-containing protein [Pseudomonadales bacterium]